MAELHGEKIDIVDWSEDPAAFLAQALQPARVSHVEIVDLEAGPPGSPCPTTSSRWRSARKGRTPGSRPG
jgi:N utilization substance protein A